MSIKKNASMGTRIENTAGGKAYATTYGYLAGSNGSGNTTGMVSSISQSGTKYAYIHNLQGDIVGIVDSTGTEVVKYTYDSWGKLLSTTGSLALTLGKLNPFRYRGYVYDEETGLYYLRSRYYNPTWGRFVNADSIMKGNLFAYCSNNPLCCKDPNGMIGTGIYSESGEEELSIYYCPYPTPRVKDANNSDIIEQISSYSEEIKTSSSSKIPYVTVSILFSRLDSFIKRKINFRSEGDSGCGSFIRGGILNKAGPHGSSIYKAGVSSMFNNDLILAGEISDIGGVDNLVVGMILGTPMSGEFSDGKYHIEHGGIYAGIIDLGNGPVPAVYSFNTDKNCGNLSAFENNNWTFYGWHKGIIMD